MAKLGDVCEILDSKRVPITASNRQPGPYPYYGANGIQDYVADYIFDDELVLLAEDGGNFGSKEKPIAYRVSGKCWINNHAHVLKPKTGLDVDYLCYSLMFYDVTGLVNGATRQKLTQADMRKMEIPLPPLDEQRHIAAVLDKVSGLISKSREQLDKLDELVKARFVEMFGDTIINPYGWNKNFLGTVCDVRDGTHESPQYYNVGFPLLTSKNVTSGKIDLTECSLISETDYNKINERSKVDMGDVIMPMIGTVGKPVVVNIEPNFAIKNVSLIKFRPNSEVLNIYIWALLQSDYFDTTVLGKIRGGTQKFISLGDIRKLEILVPPIELQNKFATFVTQADKSKLTIQQSLDKLEVLKKALMQQYFGRVTLEGHDEKNRV